MPGIYDLSWTSQAAEPSGGKKDYVECCIYIGLPRGREARTEIALRKDETTTREGKIETAWNPPLELLELIRDCYPSLKYYYAAEGDGWDWYLTNDAEGKYYSSRYVVDMEPDIEYFDAIEEACKHVSAYIGKLIAPTLNALLQAAEDWNDTHPDADWPINIQWYEIGQSA